MAWNVGVFSTQGVSNVKLWHGMWVCLLQYLDTLGDPGLVSSDWCRSFTELYFFYLRINFLTVTVSRILT